MKIAILTALMFIQAVTGCPELCTSVHQVQPHAKPVDNTKFVSGLMFPVYGCAREGDKDCLQVWGETMDTHGCNNWSGFTWDEGSKTCRTNLYVGKQPAPVTCSPLGKPDENGNQRAVCWYVPPVPEKEVGK